jgi:RimJ/RimL family protein N-acetyltransferase
MDFSAIQIASTTAADLEHICRLWNNGAVMAFVGYPQGLGITLPELTIWLTHIQANPLVRHYSIYRGPGEYCGETFYHIDSEHDLAALDIKLMPAAQGSGLGAFALSFAIDALFSRQIFSRAYVDPHPENTRAWRLYERLGFIVRPRPQHLEPFATYLEVTQLSFTPAPAYTEQKTRLLPSLT